jgi:hypothetical protein
MHDFHWIANLDFLADWTLRIGLSVRVTMRRLPAGVSLAWLTIILIVPFAGAGVYLLLGEYRLGHGRVRRAVAYRTANRAVPKELNQADRVGLSALSPESAALARLAESVLGAPALSDTRLVLKNVERPHVPAERATRSQRHLQKGRPGRNAADNPRGGAADAQQHVHQKPPAVEMSSPHDRLFRD